MRAGEQQDCGFCREELSPNNYKALHDWKHTDGTSMMGDFYKLLPILCSEDCIEKYSHAIKHSYKLVEREEDN